MTETKPRFKINDKLFLLDSECPDICFRKCTIEAIIISLQGIFYQEEGEVLSGKIYEESLFTKEEAKQKFAEWLDAK